MVDLSLLKQAVIDGNKVRVGELVQKAIEEGVTPQVILTEHMIPGMLHVGNLMAEGEYFIPEVLRSARAMGVALEKLEPLLVGSDRKTEGYVVLGSVKGDIHDIGKNLVGMLLKGNGFTVEDLGVDVPTEKFISAIKAREGTVLLGLSALITPVLEEMEFVMSALKNNGLRERVKVMVGGAPVTEEFARSIGADGTAENAAETVNLAKKLAKAC